jgi:O-antigen ligase
LLYAGKMIAAGVKIRGRASAWLLFAATALAPLPFGSATPTAVAFWAAVLGLALFAAPHGTMARPHFFLLVYAAIVVIAYGVVLHEQLALRPWFSVARPDPLWSEVSQALGTPLSPTVSIARDEPYFALGSPLICMLALSCGFIIGMDRYRARALIWIFAGSGTVYAVYGVASHLFDPTHVLWHEKTAYVGSLTAMFINRNTAAAYFGSCATVCLMLFCDLIRSKLPRGAIEWRKIPYWLLSKPPRPAPMLFGMLLISLIAMLMTNSRAGVFVSLAAIVAGFVLYFQSDLPRLSSIVGAGVGAVGAGLVLMEFIGGGVSGRLDAQGLADEGRFATWRATLRMISDHPWFGTGLGTFVWSFPAYRSSDVSMVGVWDHAHNTLLELAAEMGIPLASIVALGWILILVILFRGALVRRRDLVIPVTAFAVAVLALVHSMVDFPLQIAGYAIPALALVGVGVAQSFASGGVQGKISQTGSASGSQKSSSIA